MQDLTNLNDIAQRVYPVEVKDYKSMMLGPDGMSLLSKRVTSADEFRQAFEKGGLLSNRAMIAPEKFKSLVVERGEKKLSLNYKKLLEMGVPGELEFESEADLNEVLAYIEKKWAFHRTEQQLSPLKATLPYFGGLLVALFGTGFVIYVNMFGGSYRVNVITLLLIKLSEKIGFLPTLLLGLVICAFVIRALWKAFKNPPVEIRLEP